MKKIEKNFIFKDLDHINNEISIKMEKLNSIISLFMEEETNIIENTIIEKNKKEFEEKQRVICDESDIYSDSNVNEESNNINSDDDVNITENKIDLPDEIKSIYRKIVMITHPDKNKNQNESYSELYKKSIKAKNSNDISELLYIAYKLNLDDIYNIDDKYFNDIISKINELRTQSNNIDMNSFWVWYHTDNAKLKRIMVEQITKLNRN